MLVQYACKKCQRFEKIYEDCEYKEPEMVRHKCGYCNKTSVMKRRCFDETPQMPMIYVYKEAKTVEHLAYQNTKKMSKEQIEKYNIEKKEAKEKALDRIDESLPNGAKTIRKVPYNPWWRKGEAPGIPNSPDKPIDISKISDTKKFIEEGTT